MISLQGLVGGLMILIGISLHVRAYSRLWGIADWGLIVLPKRYVNDGVMRLRHPSYLGALLGIAGVGVLVSGLPGAALAVPALPFYADRIYREERLRRAEEQISRAA